MSTPGERPPVQVFGTDLDEDYAAACEDGDGSGEREACEVSQGEAVL